MITIRIHFRMEPGSRLPQEVELKVDRPIKVVDLILLLLDLYPDLASRLPEQRTESKLQARVHVVSGNRQVPLSETVPDECVLEIGLRQD